MKKSVIYICIFIIMVLMLSGCNRNVETVETGEIRTGVASPTPSVTTSTTGNKNETDGTVTAGKTHEFVTEGGTIPLTETENGTMVGNTISASGQTTKVLLTSPSRNSSSSASTTMSKTTTKTTTVTATGNPGNDKYKALTNIPTLYIQLDNNKTKSNITKETYLSAKISAVGAQGVADMIEMPVSVKGRGNFSWSFAKKPLTLKFESKTNMLGMGKNKKWVLINNYVDKTLLRNYITFQFAKDIGLSYTPECKFVDVYINGKYEGNYLFFEKIDITEDSVNIDKDKGGILFEIEMQFRHSDCTYCYETPNGVHIMYSDYTDKTDFKTLKANTNKFLLAMDNSLSKGYSEYSKYIDVDSFVDWYIVNEFAKNYDSQFVTSCYCYIGNDGKLHMGPVWDYDTCYANQDGGGMNYDGFHVNNAPWYKILLTDKDFTKKLKDKWTQTVIKKGLIDKMLKNIDAAEKLIEQSSYLNFEKWPDALSYSMRSYEKTYTSKAEVTFLKKFINNRKEWLDKKWNTSIVSTDPIEVGNTLLSKIDLTTVTGPQGSNENELVKSIFDENPLTKFCTPAGMPYSVKWKMKEATEVKKYYIYTANDFSERNPKTWKMYGSNDGNSWTLISDIANGDLPLTYFEYKEFTVSNPGKYLYYRLDILSTRVDGYGSQFSELVLK